jgi:membrane protease YdiL (CAAX protease family)
METPPKEEKKLPFNNLFLNSGVVNGFNMWWMYLFGTFLCIFGYLFFQIIMFFPLISAATANGVTLNEINQQPEILFNPEVTGINKNLFLALILGMYVFAFIGLYIAVVRIHKKPFKSIITAWEKVRYSRFFFAFGVWSVLLIGLCVFSYFTSEGSMVWNFDPSKFFILLGVTVFLLPIQTSTEELLFRGYLLQGLAQVTKNGIIPLIITSLLFSLLHMDNPEAKTFGWGIMFPYYALFGFFLGALTLIDEGLELALGIHCANNLISSLLVTTPSGVLKTDAIFMATNENPQADFIMWLVIASLSFIIFWLKYRWKNFNLLIK